MPLERRSFQIRPNGTMILREHQMHPKFRRSLASFLEYPYAFSRGSRRGLAPGEAARRLEAARQEAQKLEGARSELITSAIRAAQDLPFRDPKVRAKRALEDTYHSQKYMQLVNRIAILKGGPSGASALRSLHPFQPVLDAISYGLILSGETAFAALSAVPHFNMHKQLLSSHHFMVVRTDRPEVRFIPTTKEALTKWHEATSAALQGRQIKAGSTSASLQRTAPEIYGGEPSCLDERLFRKGNNSFVIGLYPSTIRRKRLPLLY